MIKKTLKYLFELKTTLVVTKCQLQRIKITHAERQVIYVYISNND